MKPEAEAAFRRAFGGLIADASDPQSPGLRVVCCGLEELDRVEGKHVDGLLGQRYLGAAVGSKAFREERVRLKVEGWVTDVRKLAALGRTYPHQAYSLLVRSLLPRWRYTMRTFQVNSSFYLPLERALVESFFPSVFGWKPSDAALRRRCALPTRKGGLGIPEIGQLADEEAGASEELTASNRSQNLRRSNASRSQDALCPNSLDLSSHHTGTTER